MPFSNLTVYTNSSTRIGRLLSCNICVMKDEDEILLQSSTIIGVSGACSGASLRSPPGQRIIESEIEDISKPGGEE